MNGSSRNVIYSWASLMGGKCSIFNLWVIYWVTLSHINQIKFWPRYEVSQKCTCLEIDRNFWKWLLHEPCLKSKANLMPFPEACFVLGKLALSGSCSSEEIIWLRNAASFLFPNYFLSKNDREGGASSILGFWQVAGGCRDTLQRHQSCCVPLVL